MGPLNETGFAGGLTGQANVTGIEEGLTTDAAAPLARPIVLLMLAAGLLPVFMVVALRFRTLVVLGQRALTLASGLPQVVLQARRHICGDVGGTTSSTDRLMQTVTTRLRERRRSIANFLAACLVAQHMYNLVRAVAVGSVCTTVHAHEFSRGFLASVHLAHIWIASAFLVIPQRLAWNSTCPDLAFLFATLVLELSRFALEGEQSLLAEGRIFRQVAWGCFMGSCVTPIVALPAILLHTAGIFAIYRHFIPDGMLFIAGTARSGLAGRSCFHILDRAQVTRSGSHMLADVAKETSFRAFATSEIVGVVIIMVGLVMFASFLSEEIMKSLRLRSAEDHILAVSQLLDRLCDATCQLSPAYCICNPAPKLDVLLHMSPTPGSMAGMEFRSLLSSEADWASIEGFFHGAMKQGASFSDAHYVDLKSACNVRVHVQMLCACFVDCAGESQLLCGVTELHADRGHVNADGPEDVIGQYRPAARRHTSPRLRHSTTRSHSGSSSSGGSSSGRIGRNAGERSNSHSGGDLLDDITQEEYALEIEVADLRVCWASRPFEKLVGVKFEASTRPCAHELFPEPQEVRACVQQCTAEDVGSDELRAPRKRRIRILMNKWSVEGEILGTPFMALCAVRFASSSGPDAERSKRVRLHVLAVQGRAEPEVRMSESL